MSSSAVIHQCSHDSLPYLLWVGTPIVLGFSVLYKTVHENHGAGEAFIALPLNSIGVDMLQLSGNITINKIRDVNE